MAGTRCRRVISFVVEEMVIVENATANAAIWRVSWKRSGSVRAKMTTSFQVVGLWGFRVMVRTSTDLIWQWLIFNRIIHRITILQEFFTFNSPTQRAVKCVCVCVCVFLMHSVLVCLRAFIVVIQEQIRFFHCSAVIVHSRLLCFFIMNEGGKCRCQYMCSTAGFSADRGKSDVEGGGARSCYGHAVLSQW